MYTCNVLRAVYCSGSHKVCYVKSGKLVVRQVIYSIMTRIHVLIDGIIHRAVTSDIHRRSFLINQLQLQFYISFLLYFLGGFSFTYALIVHVYCTS